MGGSTIADVALGLLLVVAGIAAVVDSTMPFQAALGWSLLAAGLALLVRGSVFVRAATRPWRLRYFVIATVVIVGFDVLVVVDQLTLGFSTPWLLRLGPPELAALCLLKLAIAIALARMSRLRALGMALLGLGLSLVGLDPITGALRLTWGVEELMAGISTLLVMLGLFVAADGLLGVVSPWLLVDTYVRLIARWRALDVPESVAIAMRVVAALAVAGACVVAFHLNARAWDIAWVLAIGLFGIAGKFLCWNRLVLLIAMALGPTFEQSIRQAMLMSDGDPAILWRWPIAAVVVSLAVMVLVAAAARSLLRARGAVRFRFAARGRPRPRSGAA
jgi:TctA family transporter